MTNEIIVYFRDEEPIFIGSPEEVAKLLKIRVSSVFNSVMHGKYYKRCRMYLV